VRGGQNAGFEGNASLSFLAGLPQTQRVQDSLILYEYLRGRGVVQDLDRKINLRGIFGNPQADYFSRFNAQEPIEELVYYWKRHVYVGYDVISSTITLIVAAFTPEDALNVSRTAIALSENLVNDLSERARRDALALADAALQRAQDNLQDKITQLRDLRNSAGVLDATKTADAIGKMVGDLRLELIHLQEDYDIQRGSVSASSPQLQVQQARITSLRDQIQKLEQMMTSNGSGSPTLATAMSLFDRQQLEQDIAQKQYVAAAGAFERARLELEGKHVYVATFLQPVLAQEALYPRRWWEWSIVVVACLALWGSLVGIGLLVRNYIAI
jgi:capsular polysaccharide transport system permease protein